MRADGIVAPASPHLSDARRAPAGTPGAFAALLDQAARAQPVRDPNGEMPDEAPVKAGNLWRSVFPPIDAPDYFVQAWNELRESGVGDGVVTGLRLQIEEAMYGSLTDPTVPAFGPDMTYTALVTRVRDAMLMALAGAHGPAADELRARARVLDTLLERMAASQAAKSGA